MEPGLPHYLIVSALLFSLGLLGVIARRSLLCRGSSLVERLSSAKRKRSSALASDVPSSEPGEDNLGTFFLSAIAFFMASIYSPLKLYSLRGLR